MKKNRFIKSSKWIVLVFGCVLFFWMIFWPLPDYIEGPGQANNLNSMMTVNHKKSNYSGKLMLTSVEIAPVHPITYLWAKMNPEYSIDNAKDVTGNQDSQTYNEVQKFYMQSAINNAIYVAYKRAHQPVKRDYHGIYVLNVMTHSKFHSSVRIGDVITQVNHHHFHNALGYQKYLSHLSHHSKVTIQYQHNGKDHSSTHYLTRLPYGHRYGLGVVLTDDAVMHTKIPVKVHSQQIGGPSGGLMLALQIYSEIKPDDITKGRNIAGTGTIDTNGQVGEIGGIDKKIIAAKHSHAKIFLAPYVKPTKSLLKYEPDHMTNYQLAKQTARKYAPGMKVIPIKTFWQAVRYLEKS